MTIPPELEAKILRYYHVEKWRVGTLSAQLGVHHSTVSRVLAQAGLPRIGAPRRASAIDAYLPFILETLEKFPTLTATRLHGMVTERGYVGSVDHFRHFIALHRPKPKREAYLRLRTLPGEQSQVDWGHFGFLEIGRARRALMGFVMVLSWSRMIYVHFFLGAHMENFLRGHVGAFNAWGGLTKVVLYDNLKSAVLERQGQAIRFNPTLLEFAGFHRYEPRPVAVARGNEKGRVERAIRYIRDAFFAGRTFTSLADLNAQAEAWMIGAAADRRCPEDTALTVREAFAQEQKQLLTLPDNPYPTDEQVAVKIGKTPYARFDLNDYSVPHDYVQRTLTVSADLNQVRLLNGQEVIATHSRSFDRGAQIENPDHVATLAEYKHHASQHRNTDRLTQAVPQSRELLTLAAERGEPLGRISTALLALLDRYGVTELQAAVQEALQRGVPHPNAVRLALERRREAREEPPPVAIPLPSHVQNETRLSNRTTWTPMIKLRRQPMLTDAHRLRAENLHLYGLLAHWTESEDSTWVAQLLDWEEAERARHSLERRLSSAHIGRFKPLADFDWNWPEHCDRMAITELMSLEFLKTATNAILVGASGLGKSTLAQNIAYQAVLNGHTVLFTTAGQLLGDLAALDSDSALRRRLRYYAAPSLLVIDEVGYLSYSNRHADLLFELINRRHEQKSTLVTTNKCFAEWSEVFPNAACVVALIDRLVHNAEIIAIKGKSYRQKEAQERAEQRSKKRKATTSMSTV